MPAFLALNAKQLPLHPSTVKIWAGLLIITVAAWACTALAAKYGQQSSGAYLAFGGTAAMLFNVFVPHIPAVVLFRGYTPGAITAVLINLPIMGLLMFQALREHWVTGRRALAYALLLPLALAGSIAALFVAH